MSDTTVLVFQQIDVEDAYDNSNGVVTLRLYGVTEVRLPVYPEDTWTEPKTQAGHSVLAHVTDFLPYFYVPVPRGFQVDDLDAFMENLNVSPKNSLCFRY